MQGPGDPGYILIAQSLPASRGAKSLRGIDEEHFLLSMPRFVPAYDYGGEGDNHHRE
jgi:hypothetical protein